MKKILLIMSLVLLLNLSLVSAITGQEINEAKDLLESKAGCDKLTNEQLEIIGEYYMEQMHSGESHELMHKMMGLEEGSEAEKQFHVNMAKRLYCNENVYVGYGMMGSGMMQSGIQGGMMGGMMGSGLIQSMMGSNSLGSGMPFQNYGYWSILDILYAVLLIGLIALVFLGVFKLWKDINEKKAKK